jgi:hypothetical protein
MRKHFFSVKNISSSLFYKFNKKYNFDQFKERPKRHFMVYYKYIEDMHYKRSIYLITIE